MGLREYKELEAVEMACSGGRQMITSILQYLLVQLYEFDVFGNQFPLLSFACPEHARILATAIM